MTMTIQIATNSLACFSRASPPLNPMFSFVSSCTYNLSTSITSVLFGINYYASRKMTLSRRLVNQSPFLTLALCLKMSDDSSQIHENIRTSKLASSQTDT
jgi:hypothetical protein